MRKDCDVKNVKQQKPCDLIENAVKMQTMRTGRKSLIIKSPSASTAASDCRMCAQRRRRWFVFQLRKAISSSKWVLECVVSLQKHFRSLPWEHYRLNFPASILNFMRNYIWLNNFDFYKRNSFSLSLFMKNIKLKWAEEGLKLIGFELEKKERKKKSSPDVWNVCMCANATNHILNSEMLQRQCVLRTPFRVWETRACVCMHTHTHQIFFFFFHLIYLIFRFYRFLQRLAKWLLKLPP